MAGAHLPYPKFLFADDTFGNDRARTSSWQEENSDPLRICD